MSERKTVKYFNGKQTVVTTPSEFVDYLSSIPVEARRQVQVLSGPIDSLYTNDSGKLVREKLTGDQIIRRMEYGEQPIITGATDPKLKSKTRQDQAEGEKRIASDQGELAFLNSLNPLRLTGIPQRIEDEIVGPEAIKYRQAIKQENPIESLSGSFALGIGLGGVAAKGLSAATGRSIKGLTSLAIDEASIESTLYTQHVMDNNLPFVAEDMGRQILMGMFFASPLYLGTALRRPVMAAVKGLGKAGIGKATGVAADAGVVGATTSSVPGQARKFARFAAATRVGGKVLNKLFPKTRVVAGEARVTALRKTLDAERTRIGLFTPEKLRGLSSEALEEEIKFISQFLDDPRIAKALSKADYKNMHTDINALRTALNTSRKQAKTINKGMGNLRFKGKPGKIDNAVWSQEADAVFYKIQEAGFGDIAGHLENTLSAKNPLGTYGQWAQARLDAALKISDGVGGGFEVNAMLKSFLENKNVWGSEVGARGVKINKAIDDIAESYKALNELNIPKNLDNVIALDASRLHQISKQLDGIRKGYAVLEAEGLLKRGQVAGVENALGEANRALKRGAQAYSDAGAVNRAHKQAATSHRKANPDVYQTPDELAAAQAAQVELRVKELQVAGARVGRALDGKALQGNRIVQGGILAMYALDEQQKDDLYEHITEVIPALTGSPQALEDSLGDYLGASSIANPTLSTMAGGSAASGIHWLSTQVPRRDKSFYGRFLPVAKAKRDIFNEKFIAAMVPMSTIDAAIEGRITKGMVDAVRVTNPALYTEIGILLSEALMEADPLQAPRQVINGINQLMGGIDPLYTGPALLELQSNYAQSEGQQQVIGGGASMPDASNPQKPGNQFTFTQRLTSY